ncbi:Predicted transcriptional regulator, ArsR family [Paenibacillus algorifonticola]|uniref:Predicted transcriptional regulator, ArsR family n=1 Tax=Paenibacillus algorifonticola TaxID=684063 RepID=A0A1I2GX95_9BACL|nr:metalloregulator ArsR/SmtB family transcription factor [Paenibacillus algorifonticola]SFF21226.1 Predicted transcriptional regulator, ArsR family [Paenibacillus algorifonticola]
MSRNQTNKDSSTRTRRAIIDLLKQQGGMDVMALASEFSLSGMAIRQHLNALKEEGLVTHEEEARPMGRPAKLWRLTPEANKFFPSGYSELSVSLIYSMREAFGNEGLDKLLAVRDKNMQEQYLQHIGDASDIREKLGKLAEIRTNEGYMAEIKDQDDGSFLFIEKHCPICEAAVVCTGLCKYELNLFRTVLGNHVLIERVEHILVGGRNCVYRVREGEQT